MGQFQKLPAMAVDVANKCRPKELTKKPQNTEFSEQAFYLACAKFGVDPNDAMAEFFTMDSDDLSEKERIQLQHTKATLAARLMDKFVPGKKPIDPVAATENKFELTWRPSEDN